MTLRNVAKLLCGLVLLGVTACNSGGASNSDSTTSFSSIDGTPEPAVTSVEEVVRTLPIDEQPTELGPLGSTAIELETDAGSVQIGSGDIPDLVPAGFPVPADFVVQLATGVAGAAGFSGITQLGFAELVDFYTTGLAAAGYETTQDQLIDDVVAVIDFDGTDGTGQVAISSAPGGAGRNVIVTFAT